MIVDDGLEDGFKLQYQDVVLSRCQLWPEHNEDQLAGAAIYWAADVDEHWGLDLIETSTALGPGITKDGWDLHHG